MVGAAEEQPLLVKGQQGRQQDTATSLSSHNTGLHRDPFARVSHTGGHSPPPLSTHANGSRRLTDDSYDGPHRSRSGENASLLGEASLSSRLAAVAGPASGSATAAAAAAGVIPSNQSPFILSPTRALLLISFALCAFGSYKYLRSGQLERLMLIVQSDPYGTLPVFMVVYILSVPLFFPCMVMQVISGAVYGFWMGFLLSWLATSLGQSLAFLLARHLLRAPVKRYMHANFPNFAAIDNAMRREGYKLVALLRLSPVLPYNVLNYAAALTPISFLAYSGSSAIGIIPWTILYVYLGTFSTSVLDLARGRLDGVLTAGEWGEGGWGRLFWSLLSMVAMVVTTVYGYVLSKRAMTAVLKDAERAAEAGGGSGGVLSGGSGADVELGRTNKG